MFGWDDEIAMVATDAPSARIYPTPDTNTGYMGSDICLIALPSEFYILYYLDKSGVREIVGWTVSGADMCCGVSNESAGRCVRSYHRQTHVSSSPIIHNEVN